jgi:ribose-phosphate pyrophosphokinase
MTASPFVVVSSSGMHEMAASVVSILKKKRDLALPHQKIECERFANGELLPLVPETARGQHVFFFHPMQLPDPNTALVAMHLTNDALTRAAVDGITLVAPYLSYLRQDRRSGKRVALSARAVADIIQAGGVKRIITCEMHADQAEGFFSFSVDNLGGMGIFADHFKKVRGGDFTDVLVVAPDLGSAVRARRFADKLGDLPVTICEKRRPAPNQSEVLSIIGEPVAGKTVIIFDDMIDTGGTIRGAVQALKNIGAKEVFVCAVHGIFSADAEQKFADAHSDVFVTNSIPREAAYYKKHSSWLTLVPLDDLLAEAIYQASRKGGSVSKLNK